MHSVIFKELTLQGVEITYYICRYNM